jgi:hypothetical protein
VTSEEATVTRPKIRSYVEVLDESEPAIARPAFHHLAFGRPIGAVRQQQIDDRGENEVDEHLHGGLPEHGLPPSAYV